jgi:hypothetical protein
MAHNIQKYRGKMELFNDLDMLVVMSFAIKIASESRRFEKLDGLINEWSAEIPRTGPGVIDLNLDKLIETNSQRAELKLLLNAISQHFSQYHVKIPQHIYNCYPCRELHFTIMR